MITSYQQNAIRVLVTSISTLSFISSAVAVVCFLFFGELKKGTGNQLVFSMLLADMASSLAWAMTPFNQWHRVCEAQAFLIQLFDVSAFLWTSFVALNAWLVTTRQYTLQPPVLAMSHVVGWGLPLGMAIYNYAYEFYGQQDPDFISWCWIKDTHVVARMVTYYGPLVFLWTITIILYLALLSRFRRSHTSSNHQSHRKAKRMILSFLAAFIGCKFFALVNRLQNAINPGHPVFVLMMLQGGTDPLRGFTDCVVYTFAKLRSRVRERLLPADQHLQSNPQKFKYSSV